jgi:uncharacterized protein
MRSFAQNGSSGIRRDGAIRFSSAVDAGGKAMNIEEVDGLFSALIAGPGIVMPGEYMPEVLGSETPETSAFSTLAKTNEILGLLMRHWNNIAETLLKGELYQPLFQEDANGVEHGNDWARGFIRGSQLRHDRLAELLGDDSMRMHDSDADAPPRAR